MLKRLTPALLVCAALTACSGGGSTGSGLPRTAPGSTPQAPSVPTTPQSVTVSFKIPAAGASGSSVGRRPLYISQNTQSGSISVNTGTASIIDLAANSPSCTTSTTGRVCSFTVSAPVGTDSFAVNLYANTTATGAILSQNTVSATIVAGTANTVPLTLNGVPASIALSLTNPTPPAGTATTTTLSVNVKDASGATIVGSDAFSSPITLTDSDTSGATSVTPTTITKPGDATVAYTGAALPSATFGATATTVPANSVTTATLTPQSTTTSTALVDWPTYGYDSQRSGYNPYSGAITPGSISGLHLGWESHTNGAAQTQPVVATNVAGHQALIIVGGYPSVQAFDSLTGKRAWVTTIPVQNYQECGTAGVAGTVQFDRALNAVFVGGGNGGNPNHIVLYKLDVATGAIVGQVDVTPHLLNGESVAAHTAVTMANGRLYLGLGSNCEGTPKGLPAWRGGVVSVDPSSMTVLNTFYATFGQGGNWAGGGVWSWGGVSADSSGNIYVATGNAATAEATNPQTVPPPFVQAPNEQVGYGEHLVKLTADLAQVEDSDYPGFNFQVGGGDLDYAGTPVIFEPSLGSNCGTLTATQGKGGTLVVNNSQKLSPAINSFKLSSPSSAAYYMGNPGYSAATGLLYAAISSAGPGSSLMPPGLAAIGDCGQTIVWHTQFGPDSLAYGDEAHPPRTAPTATAGGVVFIGTPCTPSNGTCGAPGKLQGAVWALDAKSSNLLGNGKPILITGDTMRMAPTADGQWLYVMDQSGDIYGLTVDPSVPTISPSATMRSAQHFRVQAH